MRGHRGGAALLVGIDDYLDLGKRTSRSFETATAKLARALPDHEFTSGQIVSLPSERATRTIVTSRLRFLRKLVRREASFLVVWSGKAFHEEGVLHLDCRDTLADDRADTSIPFAEIVKLVESSRAGAVTYLLNLILEEPAQFPESTTGTILLFQPSEQEVAALAPDGDPWGRILAEAFALPTPDLLDPLGRLTAGTLKGRLDRELPAAYRRRFGPDVRPEIFLRGEAGLPIADYAHRRAEFASLPPLSAARLGGVRLRAESFGRVKELAGFRKNFRVPDSASAASRRFVARAAADELNADLDGMLETIREKFPYKRKDILTDVRDGRGTLRTPDFEYAVMIELDSEDPSRFRKRREIGAIFDPMVVREAPFQSVFGKSFDRLVFDFSHPIDIAAFVDRMEASTDDRKVRLAADGLSCEVISGDVTARITMDSLELQSRGSEPFELLEAFRTFLSSLDVSALVPTGQPTSPAR